MTRPFFIDRVLDKHETYRVHNPGRIGHAFRFDINNVSFHMPERRLNFLSL